MIAYKESLFVKGKSACSAKLYLRRDKGATLIMADPLAIG
jgi:hypothetical protein